jgi:CubicO group peptidase (beta-lactamase class C family)
MRTTDRVRWILAGCVAVLLAQATAYADPIDDRVRAEMDRSRVPGLALAVLRDGQVVKLQGYGFADVARKVEVTPDTIFKIGSVSKPIIATGIMLLVQDGKLSLDDPVSKYLDGTPESWRGITIRHFLTHTSGVVREGPAFNPGKVQPDADVVTSSYPLPLRFPTGSKWEYCNVGYFSLAEIIRKVSGQPWADFLAARVFTPLGMTSTFPTSTKHDRRALGYDGEGNASVAADWPAVRPSGAFLSTAADLVKFERMLAGGELLTAATRQGMWTPVTLVDGTTHPYGFGWELGERGDRKYIGHGGSLPGFRSTYARFPEDRLTVIVLANADRVDRDGLVKAIADALIPKPAAIPGRP